MATVTPNITTSVPLQGQSKIEDEETAAQDKTTLPNNENAVSTRLVFGIVTILLIGLIFGLVFGLAGRGTDAETTLSQNTVNPNLMIYDEALALLESTPLQTKELPSGETLSYREYHAEEPRTLVVLPGFMADDSMTSILAVLPEFHDHRECIMHGRCKMLNFDTSSYYPHAPWLK